MKTDHSNTCSKSTFLFIFLQPIYETDRRTLFNNDVYHETRGKLKMEGILKKKTICTKMFLSSQRGTDQNIYKREKNTTLAAPTVLSGFSFTLWFVSNKGCTLAFHHLSFPIYYEEQGRVHTYTSEIIGL